MTNSDDFQFEYYSSVTQSKIEWLWYPYIPYGKLTILQGDPGEGKSTFMLNIAALLTRGKPMPDGYKVSGPQNVIYQTVEDNLSDTVKPRLIAAGADCEKVAYIVDTEDSLTLEDGRIERVLRQTNARLFILDPLQGYLSQDSDLLVAGRMRQQLKQIANIAAKYSCAMVIIGHMNKSSGEKNLYRGLGSIDIAAIARSVLMISRDKTDPSIRYMFPVKSSLAPEGKTVAFSLDRKRGLRWLGQRSIDPKQIDDCYIDKSKKALAIRILKEVLGENDAGSAEIVNKLKMMGVSPRTIYTAKRELGITSYRKDSAWFWHYDGKPSAEGG